MKQLKNLLFATLLALLALPISCSEDPVKEVPATGPESGAPIGEAMNARMGATTGDQIPDIVGELERLTGKSAGNASKGMNLNDVAIDFSDIRWIIGQNTGRTNYTFPVLVKGQGMEAFYNLIVMVEPDGEILPPIVREYRVAPNAMEGFRASGYDLAGSVAPRRTTFSRTFSTHPLTWTFWHPGHRAVPRLPSAPYRTTPNKTRTSLWWTSTSIGRAGAMFIPSDR